MKYGFIGLCATVFISLISSTAFANTLLTKVTNDYTASNGCTVASIAGGGYTNYSYTIFRVTCGADVAYSQKIINYGMCSMTDASANSGYSVYGNCGNYSVYKNTPASTSSSSSSSSVPAQPVTITRVVNDVSDIGCAVQSVAGGQNYIVYTVTCPGHPVMSIQKTYNGSICTVSRASSNTIVTGSCNDYRVKR